MKKLFLVFLVLGQLSYGQNEVKKDSAQCNHLEEIVVTANRGKSIRKEVPVAISKISQTVINETKPTAVYEVVNKVPGVLMVNLGNEQHSMSIRQPMTTNAYYLYLEDGLPVRPLGVFNHNALLEINQFNLQNIEVMKGPSSSLYGSEAVGGAINLISLKPSLDPVFKFGIQADQWGYHRFQAAGGATIGKVGFHIAGLSARQQNSWMTYSDYNKDNINARVDYNINPKTRLFGTFFYGSYYSEMSGSVNESDYENRTYKSKTDFAYRKSDAMRSKLVLERDWNPDSHSSLTVFTRDNELGQNPAYAINWTAPQTTAKGEINSNNFKSYGAVGQHTQKMEFINSEVVVGGVYDYSPVNYNAYEIDLKANLNPDGKTVNSYEIVAEHPDIKLYDYESDIYNKAGFVQFNIKPINEVVITAGGRYDNMSFDYNNHIDQSAGKKTYDRFTGKFGVNYNPWTYAGFYTNYSQGFAPPALTSFFRAKKGTGGSTGVPAQFIYYNLKPADFENFEVGGWLCLFRKKLNIEYSLYYMEGRNELISVRQPSGSTDYQSAGETLHKGIEFAANYSLNEQFKVRIGGTVAQHLFVDFKISDNPADPIQDLDGKEMPSAPKWIANSEVYYYPKWFPNFRVSAEWQYVSSWYQDQLNTVKYDGYNVLNGRVGYLWKGLEMYVNIMNVTDNLYAYNVQRTNPTSQPSYNVAAPRTFVFGLQYNLNLKKKNINTMKINLFLLFAAAVLHLQSNYSQITVSEPLAISSKPNKMASCPFFTKNTKGQVVMSFGKETEREKETVICFTSYDEKEKRFQTPIEIPSSKGVELHGENMSKMLYKPNGDIIAVWGIDNPTPKKKYGGLIQYSQSFDNGKNWSPAERLVKDSTGIDQRYFDIDVLPNGEVAVIWLDNRTKTDLEGSTLYFAATNGKNGFQNEKPIGETICQCCRTDLFVGQNGAVYASYRDIINEEIRDMVLSCSVDNGKSFSNAERISPDDWKIKGCPHTGPAMAQNEKGLHFAWFTMGGGAGVFYANSFNNGKSFSKRDSVSDNPSAKHPQITVLNNKEIWIVWDESIETEGHFYTRIGLQHRDENGKILETKFISAPNGNASFPVIKAVNSTDIVVAWSENGDSQKVYYETVRIE